MRNIVRQYLKEENETLDEWLDLCIELADQVLHWCDRHKIEAEAITLTPMDEKIFHSPVGEGWALHQVILSQGLIHDAYIERPMKIGRYLQKLFPNQRVKIENFGRDGEPSEIYDSGRLLSSSLAA